MKTLLRFTLSLVLAALTHIGLAGPYPDKPIKIVVPYPPGGTADFFAQVVAQRLTEQWGHRVLVEPRPGAGGNIGSDYVAKSTPDGYTLLLGTSGSNAVNPTLFSKLPYDALRDLVLVATVANTANVLVASPAKPFNTVQELIAHAKNYPGKLTFASSGNGSVLHLSGELLKIAAGINMVHVPYKGTPPALVDVMSGRVDMMVANAPSVVGQIKSGALKALAVTGAQRAAALPGVPTMIEAGVPGYDLSSWFGVIAPAGTPVEVIAKLNAEINRLLQLPQTQEKFAAQGAEPLIMSAEQSSRYFHEEIAKWAKIVTTSGAKVD